jgi:cysteine desulfurase
MGLSREEADCTIRYSCGYATTCEEIRGALDATERAVKEVSSALGDPGES